MRATHPPFVERTNVLDLAAFVAVLVTGVILIVIGHQAPGAMATETAALGALYVTWHRAAVGNRQPDGRRHGGRYESWR